MPSLAFALLFAAAAPADDTLVLPVGAVHEFPLQPGEAMVRSSNRQSLTTESSFQSAKGTAIKVGAGELEFADDATKRLRGVPFQVVTNDLFRNFQAVRRLLRGVKGLEVNAVDNRIVLEGKLADPTEMERVRTVQAAYVDDVLNLAFDSRGLCDAYPCRHNAAPESPGESAVAFLPDWGPNDPIAAAVRGAIDVADAKKLPPDAQRAIDDYEAQMAAAMKKAAKRLGKLRKKYEQTKPEQAEAIAGEIKGIEELLGHYDRAPASRPQ